MANPWVERVVKSARTDVRRATLQLVDVPPDVREVSRWLETILADSALTGFKDPPKGEK